MTDIIISSLKIIEKLFFLIDLFSGMTTTLKPAITCFSEIYYFRFLSYPLEYFILLGPSAYVDPLFR